RSAATISLHPLPTRRSSDLVLIDELVDPSLVLLVHVDNDQVLVAGKVECARVNPGNFTHARKQLQPVFIPQTSRLDVQAKMPFAIFALNPSVMVAIVVKMVWACRFQVESDTSFKF